MSGAAATPAPQTGQNPLADWADVQLLAPFFPRLSHVAASAPDAVSLHWITARVCSSWQAAVADERARQVTLTMVGSRAACRAVSQQCPALQKLTLHTCAATDEDLLHLASACQYLSELTLKSYPEIEHKDRQGIVRWTEPDYSHSSELRSKLRGLRTSIELRLPMINLKVETQDGNEIFFKMHLDTRLSKLMHAFCQRQGVALSSVRFLFDGTRINEHRTPIDLRMCDGDVVDVMVEQQNVGEWAPATTTSPFEAALLDDTLSSPLSGEAFEIARAATGPSPSRRSPAASYHEQDAMLTVAQCEALVAHADRVAVGSGEACDLKIDLSAAELACIVGSSEVHDAILAMG
eukprot:3810600-Prymnesium_polylepis.1